MHETNYLYNKEYPVSILEFDVISDIAKYVKEGTPSSWFNKKQTSHEISDVMTNFCKTRTFTDAYSMLTEGWYEGSKKLEKHLTLEKGSTLNKLERKFVQDVVGFQPIVANYLMGIPKSMVNSKMVMRKEKVVTLNYCASFSGAVSANTIEENCITAFRIVKAIEAAGTRVNLNVFYAGCVCDYQTSTKRYNLIKLRIKGANERLNIAKMAFPMVHPSFLRRILFRVIEVSPSFTREYVGGYGRVVSNDEFAEVFKDKLKGEYIIPTYVADSIDWNEDTHMLDALIKV